MGVVAAERHAHRTVVGTEDCAVDALRVATALDVHQQWDAPTHPHGIIVLFFFVKFIVGYEHVVDVDLFTLVHIGRAAVLAGGPRAVFVSKFIL